MINLFHYFSNKANSSNKTTIFQGITTLFLLSLTIVWVDSLRILKKIFFSSLRSCYHKLANREKLILLLEKYFKTLNDMIIGTAGTTLLELFTIFQSRRNNVVKIWVFDATRGISRYRKLPLILILQMK